MDAHPNPLGSTRPLLVVALASSGGLHAALVSDHVDESQTVGALFALSALLLIALALVVERFGGRRAVAVAAVLLAGLLALYVASRFAVVWPLEHAEPVDAIGAVTKLFEAGGLLLAIGLLQDSRTAAKELTASTEGVDP